MDSDAEFSAYNGWSALDEQITTLKSTSDSVAKGILKESGHDIACHEHFARCIPARAKFQADCPRGYFKQVSRTCPIKKSWVALGRAHRFNGRPPLLF